MSDATSPAGSRLDPEPTPRRDFLGMAALLAAAGAFALSLLGALRLPRAAVLPSLSKKFRVRLPDTVTADAPFIPPGRNVALFRDADGVYAISLLCPHLGCIVKHTGDGFECPCHGSRFAADGSVTKGPSPKALAWRPVTAAGDDVLVDEGAEAPAGKKLPT